MQFSIYYLVYCIVFVSILWWYDCMLSECVLYNIIAGKYDIMYTICNCMQFSIYYFVYCIVFVSILWWYDCMLSECVLYNIIAGKYDIMYTICNCMQFSIYYFVYCIVLSQFYGGMIVCYLNVSFII